MSTWTQRVLIDRFYFLIHPPTILHQSPSNSVFYYFLLFYYSQFNHNAPTMNLYSSFYISIFEENIARPTVKYHFSYILVFTIVCKSTGGVIVQDRTNFLSHSQQSDQVPCATFPPPPPAPAAVTISFPLKTLFLP